MLLRNKHLIWVRVTQHSHVFKFEPILLNMFQQTAADKSKFKCNPKTMDPKAMDIVQTHADF